MADPSGAGPGLPLEWLRGSPFRDYLRPGLVLLLVLGAVPLVAAYGVWTRRPWAWPVSVLVGARSWPGSGSRSSSSAFRARRCPRISTLDEDSIALEYGDDRLGLIVVVRLRGAGRELLATGGTAGVWSAVLSTEDADLAADPQPVSIDRDAGVVRLGFSRPGGVLLLAEEFPRR